MAGDLPLQAPAAAMAPISVHWLARALAGLDWLLTAVLLAAVAVMVVVVSSQVALRYGFNRSLDWADEIGRLAFVWAIFLAIPLGVRDGAHIGIDVVVDKLPPAVQAVLRRAAAVLCALLMLAIAWASLGVAREQWDEMLATVNFSVGWFIVPVGIGALLSALHFIRYVLAGPLPRRAGSAE
jgi:TRAP-type C4-dicarboxylate transport system permease small subunit